MATRTTTLFTLDAVKAYLPVTGSGSDSVIEQIADGVSERIEALTGRLFVTRSKTWTGDAQGKTSVRLPWFPITGISSIKRRSSLTEDFSAAMDASSYTYDARLGIVYLKSEVFYSGPLTTEIVVSAGFGAQGAATLPAAIVQAGLDYCKFVWTRQQNGMLVAGSVSQGGNSVLVVPEPPKDIRDVIAAFRLVRL